MGNVVRDVRRKKQHQRISLQSILLSEYFTCSQSGLFPDIVNCKFGRYIECVDDIAISRSCPPGSYFNTATKQCSMNGACPR